MSNVVPMRGLERGPGRCIAPIDFAEKLRGIADRIENDHATDSAVNPKSIVLLVESHDGGIYRATFDDGGMTVVTLMGILAWAQHALYAESP